MYRLKLQILNFLIPRLIGRWVISPLLFFLAGLLPLSASAGEKVFYYHNDALGSPVVMTDAAGNVVWRMDYEPFGDAAGLGGIAPNSHQFIGKEYDLDTGLYYFGARFYDGGIGRFLSIDPVLLNGRPGSALRIPQRLTLYAYAINNPYRYLDRGGNWPTHGLHVHQASIERVLKGQPSRDINILSHQQVVMDEDQSSKGAFKHAMRGPNETAEEAWRKANDFARSELQIARVLEQQGHHEEALEHLGNAMHTMQDATSPEHGFDKVWDENESFEGKKSHVEGELYDPGKNSSLDKATQRAVDLFRSVEPYPQEIVPKP